MNLSTLSGIIITLIFIYWVLSLVTSEIQEIIASFFNLRGKNFRQSLMYILGENQNQNHLPITEKLYERFFNFFLNKSTDKTKISSEKFAHALIKILKEILNYQNNKENPSAKFTVEEILDDINNSVLPEKLKLELSLIIEKTKKRLETTQIEFNSLTQEIEEWFDESMKYASQRYKEKSKLISFILGFILVIVFNVDTINIIDNLSKSEILVSTVSQSAIEVVQSNLDKSSCSEIESEENLDNCIHNIQSQINLALNGIDNLPIGWNLSDPFSEQLNPFNITNLIQIIIGWLISTLAISMGAPFWFDIITNIINFKKEMKQKEK